MNLQAFCQEHGIVRLALFGSQASGAAGPASDVDLLVEFAPDRVPGLLRLAAIEDELSRRFFNGQVVDLRTYEDLSRHFRDQVAADSKELFAA